MPPRVDALRELIASGHLPVGTVLFHSPGRGVGAHGHDIEATVETDGVNVGGTVYKSLSTAAMAVTGHSTNGWAYWHVRTSGKPVGSIRSALPAK